MKLNENEMTVLRCLVDSYSEDEPRFMYFRGIAADTKLDVKVVRRAARSLARKGLAEFARGLFDEDGMVAGSGYGATRAGAALISPCDVCGTLATYEYDGKRECDDHYGKSPHTEVKVESIQPSLI